MNTNANGVNKPRGFAALTAERRSEISRKGGVIAHLKGSAHEWDSAAARVAGRKGGLSNKTRRAVTSQSIERPVQPLAEARPRSSLTARSAESVPTDRGFSDASKI
jgi:general stress protein YciG